MTKQEIVNYFHDTFNSRKTDMRTIRGLMEVADKIGYKIVKNGVDDFQLYEKDFIVNFTKPLYLDRRLPSLSPTKMYNGVPVELLQEYVYYGSYFNSELWCYLMNKKDGDFIHFDEIISLGTDGCKDVDSIVKNFDMLAHFGWARETDYNITIYAYPLSGSCNSPFKYIGSNEFKRFAPYKYLN